MNKIDPEKEELLDGLLTDAERTAAPGIDQVLAGVRRERHARSSRRVLAGTLAVMLLLGLLVLRHPEEDFQPVVAVVPKAPAPAVVEQVALNVPEEKSETASLKIERIDDQQLMEMLADMPVALVKYPDGNRRLMMVVDQTGQ